MQQDRRLKAERRAGASGLPPDRSAAAMGTWHRSAAATNRQGARVAEAEVDQLRRAIEGLHRCSASLAQSVPVVESRGEEIVWEGVVHVFDLAGHPTASRVYAWSSSVESSDKPRYFAVMHEGSIVAPADAVRAVIEAERRKP